MKKFATSILVMLVLVGCGRSESDMATSVALTVEAMKTDVPEPTATIKRIMLSTPVVTKAAASVKTARLYCPECKEVGMNINIWEKPSREGLRTTGSLAHGTRVNVIDTATYDGQKHYKITAGNVTGWVSSMMISMD